jgi:UDP-N-acetylmuramyl tripeptide synthase
VRLRLAIWIGRIVRSLARARGGGSAIPGRIARLIEPGLLRLTIGKVPEVIFVTGSNGKSTTTGMVVALLRAHGLHVFTNPAGSNLPQGLASAVLADVDAAGRIDADIAVLEVDEAYGPQISAELTPDHLVVTNLQVDQLNRFGEPERVWDMMRTVAAKVQKSLLVNVRESALVSLAHALPAGSELSTIDVDQAVIDAHPFGLVAASIYTEPYTSLPAASATLVASTGPSARISMESGESVEVTLPGEGLHYGVDATLAISLAHRVVSDFSLPTAAEVMKALPPVYGRGEVVTFEGCDFQLIMQKNLPSMQVNLRSIHDSPKVLWVAVDEGTPDPSWLFDLDLGPITRVDVLTGTKAWQWATFLGYRGVAVGEVIEDTKKAMVHLASLASSAPITSIVNYEQMMKIRRIAGLMDLEGGS